MFQKLDNMFQKLDKMFQMIYKWLLEVGLGEPENVIANLTNEEKKAMEELGIKFAPEVQAQLKEELEDIDKPRRGRPRKGTQRIDKIPVHVQRELNKGLAKGMREEFQTVDRHGGFHNACRVFINKVGFQKLTEVAQDKTHKDWAVACKLLAAYGFGNPATAVTIDWTPRQLAESAQEKLNNALDRAKSGLSAIPLPPGRDN